jgi:hypothetical protein
MQAIIRLLVFRHLSAPPEPCQLSPLARFGFGFEKDCASDWCIIQEHTASVYDIAMSGRLASVTRRSRSAGSTWIVKARALSAEEKQQKSDGMQNCLFLKNAVNRE